jgi:hypothetical protein
MHETAKKVKGGSCPSAVVHSPSSIDVVEEAEVPPDGQALDHSLRLLARWILSAARSGALPGGYGPANEVKNDLDMFRAAKVMSEPR